MSTESKRPDDTKKTPMQVDPGRGKRPEDPSDRPGQLTRDNVNPNIPSGKLGDPVNSGGIVDPTSLGMPQGGVAAKTMEPEGKSGQPAPLIDPLRTSSINEPPGSNVYDKVPPPKPEVDPEKARVAKGTSEADETDLSDPDEMEDEIEEAEDDGDVKKIDHRTPPSKRKR